MSSFTQNKSIEELFSLLSESSNDTNFSGRQGYSPNCYI